MDATGRECLCQLEPAAPSSAEAQPRFYERPWTERRHTLRAAQTAVGAANFCDPGEDNA